MATEQRQILRQRGTATDSVLSEGYGQIEQRHFKKAIKTLQPLSDEKGHFALASAYLWTSSMPKR